MRKRNSIHFKGLKRLKNEKRNKTNKSPTLFASTFAIRRSQRTDQKLQKSFHLTDTKENFIFFSNPLKNKKRTVQQTRQ
jgi:hypothetical protein